MEKWNSPILISLSIQTDLRHSIRAAMDHWKDRTCLRFTLQNGERDCGIIIMTKRDYLLLVDEEVVKLLTWIQSMGVGMEQLCMKLGMLLVLALTEKIMSE